MTGQDRNQTVKSIESTDDTAQLRPAEIAKLFRVKRSTLKGHLDNHADLFPCLNREENGYRKYGKDFLRRYFVFQSLRGSPARLTVAEIRLVFARTDLKALWNQAKHSNRAVFDVVSTEKLLEQHQ